MRHITWRKEVVTLPDPLLLLLSIIKPAHTLAHISSHLRTHTRVILVILVMVNLTPASRELHSDSTSGTCAGGNAAHLTVQHGFCYLLRLQLRLLGWVSSKCTGHEKPCLTVSSVCIFHTTEERRDIIIITVM